MAAAGASGAGMPAAAAAAPQSPVKASAGKPAASGTSCWSAVFVLSVLVAVAALVLAQTQGPAPQLLEEVKTKINVTKGRRGVILEIPLPASTNAVVGDDGTLGEDAVIAISARVNNAQGARVALCAFTEREPSFLANVGCGRVAAAQLVPSVDGGDGDDVVVNAAKFDIKAHVDAVLRPAGSSVPAQPLRLLLECHNSVNPCQVSLSAEAHVVPSRSIAFYMGLLAGYGARLSGEARAIGQAIAGAQMPAAVGDALRTVADLWASASPESCAAVEQSPWAVDGLRRCRRSLTTGRRDVDMILRSSCGALFSGHFVIPLTMFALVAAAVPLNLLGAGVKPWAGLFTHAFRWLFAPLAAGSFFQMLTTLLFLAMVGGELSSALNCDAALWGVFWLVCGGAGAAAEALYMRLTRVPESAGVRRLGASPALVGMAVALLVLRPHDTVVMLGQEVGSPLVLLVATAVIDLVARVGGGQHPCIAGTLGGAAAGAALATLRLAAVHTVE